MRYKKGTELFTKDFTLEDFRKRAKMVEEWLKSYQGTSSELEGLLASETKFEACLEEWAKDHPKQETFDFGPYWKG